MIRSNDSQIPTAPESQRFLRRVLLRLRWVTIALLLLITFVMPTSSGVGLPTWVLVAVFASYNLLIDLLRVRWLRQFSFAQLAILDLLMAGLLYVLCAEPGGPIFILFVLAVDSAAAGLTVRGTLLYTIAISLIAAVADITLLVWSPTPMDLRLLTARLTMLILVGIGMAIVMRRLVLEQAVARSVRDEAERLEEFNRLRTNFIATISHDLRTPLTATRAGLGALETSTRDRLQPNEQQLLSTMRRNTERLSMLITDLLTFNQLEAGVLHLDREPLDLRTVVTEAISAVHPLIVEKKQTLEVDFPELLPCIGDMRRLEQVIVNVLANAHMHTPPGTRILITGRVVDSEVLLSISDTGPGFPAEASEQVFQRFHRLTQTEDGSGLGLAIARGIVELHQGRIWAASQPGKGATFSIALPRAQNGDAQ